MNFRIVALLYCIAAGLLAADVSEKSYLDIPIDPNDIGEFTDEDIVDYGRDLDEIILYCKEEKKLIDDFWNHIMKLNVGGVRIKARRSTLCSRAGSPLAAMFDEESPMQLRKNMKKGQFFDEDPEIFRHVLNFLRDGTIPTLSPNEYVIFIKMMDKLLGIRLPAPEKRQPKNRARFMALRKLTPRNKPN